MSSGTKVDPSAARRIIAGTTTKLGGNANSGDISDKIARLGLSPRQQRLNRLWAVYRCQQYDGCKVDWDGREHVDPVSHEGISTAGFIPPGFYDAGQSFPIKFRRPTAPFHLGRAITNRFTGLLFADGSHPDIRVSGDDDTAAYAQALIRATRMWQVMMKARTFGGACGSVCVSFQFVNGKPQLQVHDPRWVTPVFADPVERTLASFEIRYMFPKEMRNPRTGKWEDVWFWYRRVVTDTADILFAEVPVGDGEEPFWTPVNEVIHNFGFCPGVWIQNMPMDDDIDGDPDCHGAYDSLDAMDRLLAMANKAVIANGDPTLIVKTNSALDGVSTGSAKALQLPTDGDAKFLELNGQSSKAALEIAGVLRSQILEVVQCVLEPPDIDHQKTATEVNRGYSSMESKCDVFREQYGERGVKALLEMMLKAAALLGTPNIKPEGGIEKKGIILPPRLDEKTGKVVPQKLGSLDVLMDLRWPAYFGTSIGDAVQAVQAAATAKTANLVDQYHATAMVAEYFGIENVDQVVEKLEAAALQAQADMAASMLSAVDSDADEKPEPNKDEDKDSASTSSTEPEDETDDK